MPDLQLLLVQSRMCTVISRKVNVEHRRRSDVTYIFYEGEVRRDSGAADIYR